MFSQEIINGIKQPIDGANVVIKLDMVKGYDRVSWAYSFLVLRRIGFGKILIKRVWINMINNSYYIVING